MDVTDELASASLKFHARKAGLLNIKKKYPRVGFER